MRCQGPWSRLPTLPQWLQAHLVALPPLPQSNRPSRRVRQYQQHRLYDNWRAKLV